MSKILPNAKDNNDDVHQDQSWPFVKSKNSYAVASPEIITQRRAKWGAFYSIPLSQTSPTERPLRLGESQTQRTSQSLGKLSRKSARRGGNNNDDATNQATSRNVLCWYRFKVWWIRPTVITVATNNNNNNRSSSSSSSRRIPPETIALLFQDDNNGDGTVVRYRFILPCSSCSLRAAATDSDDDDIVLVSSEPSTTCCTLYCGVGSDPHALIREGLWGISRQQATTTAAAAAANSATASMSACLPLPPRRRIKTRKTSFLNGLGWCSWNAFYTQISGTKLVQAVQDLTTTTNTTSCSSSHDCDTTIPSIPMRWIIIDDGWQQTTNDAAENGQQWSERLSGWKESCIKFNPDNAVNNNKNNTQIDGNEQLSLKDAITNIKQQARVLDVWVWHTLMGYWLGVDPSSPAFADYSKLYYPHFSKGIMDNDQSATNEASVTKGIGIYNNADEFFDKYHGYLKSCGVSGVKVDAQGVVGILRPYGYNLNDTHNDDSVVTDDLVMNLHQGLANSVHKHFTQQQHPTCSDGDTGGEISPPAILHCMAHSPKIFHNLRTLYSNSSLPLFRASDDHYPNNPYSHGQHIVACAYNSLLFSHVSIPDWDMFTTQMQDERMVQLHAVARCLSGGPIYLSDPPLRPAAEAPNGKNNNDIRRNVMDWICCKDGTTLPCRETALPIASCLLMDPLAVDSKPLVISNTNGARRAAGTQNADDGDGDYDDSAGITSGAFGVFHLGASGRWDPEALDYRPEPLPESSSPPRPKTQSVSLRPQDIPALCVGGSTTRKFLVVPFFHSHQAKVLESCSDELILQLEPLHCDAVAILPILECNDVSDNNGTKRTCCCLEIAVLGFAGKINGAGAVLENHVYQGEGNSAIAIHFKVQGCGTFLVAVRNTSPTKQSAQVKTQVNGVSVRHTYWHANSSTDPTINRDEQKQNQHATKVPDGVLRAGFDIVAVEVEETSILGEEQDIIVHLE